MYRGADIEQFNVSIEKKVLQIAEPIFQVLKALTKSSVLKRKMISATRELPASLPVWVGKQQGGWTRLKEQLGSGMTGVVYECDNPNIVYKKSRANFDFFIQMFELEKRVTELLLSHNSICCAQILYAHKGVLVKEKVFGQTLQSILIEESLSERQILELEQVIEAYRLFFQDHGFVLDISPKNLCWVDGWVLIDAGPQIRLKRHPNQISNWEDYFQIFKHKLVFSESKPSALHLASEVPLIYDEYVFVREWNQWFPLEDLKRELFFVELIKKRSPELIFKVGLNSGVVEQLNPVLPHIVDIAKKRLVEELEHLHISSDKSELILNGLEDEFLKSKEVFEHSAHILARRKRELSSCWLWGELSFETNDIKKSSIKPKLYQHWSDLIQGLGTPTDIFSHQSQFINSQRAQKVLNLLDCQEFKLKRNVRGKTN